MDFDQEKKALTLFWTMLFAGVLWAASPAFAAGGVSKDALQALCAEGNKTACKEYGVVAEHRNPKVNWGTGIIPTQWSKWGDKNVHGEPKESEPKAAPMSPPFVLVVVNFAVVIFLLWKFAVPGLKSFVQKRHTDIKESLEEAASLKAAAQEKLDEFGAKLSAAKKESEELVTSVKADAEQEKKMIEEEAKRFAEASAKDAEKRIAAQAAQAKSVLQAETVAKAVEAAHELVAKEATAADNTALVDSFLADLEAHAKQIQAGRGA